MRAKFHVLLFATLWGAALAALPASSAPELSTKSKVVTITMKSDRSGSDVYFDPIGLYVEPGTTVRWVIGFNAHSTSAYHPRNDNHALRIPDGARPWDSGVMMNPGDHFDVRLTVPGVYDYFCMPHEGAGMVGRIVVGTAPGIAARPFVTATPKAGHTTEPVPPAAQKAFPSVERILRERVVHRGH